MFDEFNKLPSELKILILDSTTDPIFVHDFEGNIKYVNIAASVGLGYNKEDLMKMNLHQVDVPEYAKLIKPNINELIEKGESTFESVHYRNDGYKIPVEIHARIVKSTDEDLILSVVRNKNLHKNYYNLETAVKKRNAELECLILEQENRESIILKLNQLKQKLLGTAELEKKLKIITDSVVTIFEADFARIWIVKSGDLCDKECVHGNVTEKSHICLNHSSCLHLTASSGRYTHIDGDHRRVPIGSYKIGIIAAGLASKFVTNNVTSDPMVHDHEWARELDLVSFAGFKLSSKDGKPVGVLALFRKKPLDNNSEIFLEDLANTTSQVIIAENAEEKLNQSEYKFRNIFKNVQDIFYQTDNNGNITEISPSIERYSGYKASELIGHHAAVFYNNLLDRKNFLEQLKLKGEVVDYELQLKTKDKSLIYVSANTHVIHDLDGNPIGLEGTLRDITERKKVAKALKESEQRLTDIIDFLPDATFAIDQNGKVIAWNRAIEKMTGTKKEDIIGKGDYAYSVPWYNERRPVLIDLIGTDNSEYASKYKYVHKNGKSLYAEIFVPSVYGGKGAYLWVTASPLLDNKGQQYGAIESVRDISARKKIEDALKMSESLYRTIFENTGAATLIYNKNGIITMINSEMEHLSGYSRKEVEGRMGWMKFVHPEDLKMMIDNHLQREQDLNSAPSKYETRFINRNGEIIYAQITVDKIPGNEEYITSVVDITEQKKQHDNLRWELKINQALNKLYVPLVSKQTNLENISATILEESLKLTDSKLGYVGEILPNTQDMIMLSVIPPMSQERDVQHLFKLKEDGLYEGLMGHSLNIKQGFYTNNAPSHAAYVDSHGLKVKRFLSVPVILKGELVGQISISNSTRDYNEKDLEAVIRLTQFYAMALQKVRYEKELKNSLAEKEVLLREIHHRVKNNMQIISSLLNLQIQYEDLDETIGVLKESQGRVKSMAIIHEKLYQSSNITSINFKEYIEQLIFDIFYSYGIPTDSIEFILNFKDINLNIDTSIPLGLIINELVTNSIKYAFPKGKGKITLKLVSNQDKIELIIADDGIGMPKDLDLENSKTLGLQLVNNLVNQLEGKLELDVSRGTEFKITFKEVKYKKRL